MQQEKAREAKRLDYGRQHDLTIDEIRECEWFGHLSDKEAQEVADTIRRFTEIIYHYYRRKQQEEERP